MTTKSASLYAAFASSVAVRFSSFSARYFDEIDLGRDHVNRADLVVLRQQRCNGKST